MVAKVPQKQSEQSIMLGVVSQRMKKKTNIEVTTDTWRELNQQKEPGDTFDDVIQRLLSETE